jgi:hypothetical protein
MPIVNCLRQLPRVYKEDEGMRAFIDEAWGGPNALKMVRSVVVWCVVRGVCCVEVWCSML